MSPLAPSPLVRDLQAALGVEAVLFEPEDLLPYEYDASIDRHPPDAVVLPRTTEDAAAAARIADEHAVPVVPRGSGTGFAGGALAAQGGVLIVLTRMNAIREIDVANRLAVVEPGVINLDLQDALTPHGLVYAPDPSSQRICTIGGNVGTNSGGPHTLAHGSTVNHILGLEVVLPGGRITNLGARQLDAPGIDLRGLFVGSEGTLGIVTAVTVRLIRQNEAVRTMLAIFDTVDEASNAVSEVIRRRVVPMAMEMLDQETIRVVEPRVHPASPPPGGAVLLIEVDGLAEAVAHDSEIVIDACRSQGAREVRTAEEEAEREALWEGRKSAIGALGHTAPALYLLDGVVPRSRLPEVLGKVLQLSAEYGFRCANMFHAGDGNLHPTILFDPEEEGATERVMDLGGEIMRLCVDAGGSITGEHGIGTEKREYMSWVFSEADLEAMGRVRLAFDPAGRFNPCKILPNGHGCAQGHFAPIKQHLGAGAYV